MKTWRTGKMKELGLAWAKRIKSRMGPDKTLAICVRDWILDLRQQGWAEIKIAGGRGVI